MSWNSGGNSGGSGPWGPPGRPNGPRPPPGRGGPPFPDLDEFLAWLRASFGGGGPGRPGGLGPASFGGGRGLALLVVALLGVWLASGLFRVQPDQQGLVLRFGAYVRSAGPGLNYHLPWPIETVERPAVTRINRIEIGYRSRGRDEITGEMRPPRDVGVESLMLTGDENIIDINFTVFWHISNAADFLFGVRNPEETVKSAAESVMREVIGRTPIQPALTAARAQIETAVNKGTQAILDRYGAGVEVTQVQLQRVDPPAAVIDSFRDVQRANTDAERMRNEAEAYHNDIVPRARGDAAHIVADADGARQAAIAEATGRAQRFDSVLAAYRAAKDVTLRRLYIDAMQSVVEHAQTVVVDPTLKGVLPLLTLAPEPARPQAPPASPSPPPSTTPSGAAQPGKAP